MNSWLLPDGIKESLPDDAENLESLRRQLVDLYATWGYRLVMPPMVEYLESLRAGMGTQLDLQTFKVTDQLNGRMMGIRADITPQVARMDAHRLSQNENDEIVNRLCYIGTVLRTRSAQQGGSRSPVQVGAELFGHAGLESDFEIISLMLQTLEAVGVHDLVIDLGHVGVANGVASFCELSEGQKQDYFDMLARKSLPEIQDWVVKEQFEDEKSEMLKALPLLSGDSKIIEKAKIALQAAGQKVIQSLQHLQDVNDLIVTHYPSLTCHIDLAEMRGYAYHTGIMYTVYKPGQGNAVAHGGRYDGIGKAFGNSRPAIGFSTDLRTLASLSPKKSNDISRIVAPYDDDQELHNFIKELRANGENVIRQLDATSKLSPQQLGCDRIIQKQGDSWTVVSV